MEPSKQELISSEHYRDTAVGCGTNSWHRQEGEKTVHLYEDGDDEDEEDDE